MTRTGFINPREPHCAHPGRAAEGTAVGPQPVVLQGPRVLLRPFKESDITEEYLSWLNDPEVARYLDTGGSVATKESVQPYLRKFQHSAEFLMLAIIERRAGRHIGNITVNWIHPIHRTAYVGIMVGRKECWGQGYGAEALQRVLEYLFCQRHLLKVNAVCVVDNARSLRLFKKLGFRVEATLRMRLSVDGVARDKVRLSLFRDEPARTAMPGSEPLPSEPPPDQQEERLPPCRALRQWLERQRGGSGQDDAIRPGRPLPQRKAL